MIDRDPACTRRAARIDEETVIRLRRVVLRLARQLNAASLGEGLTPTQASVLSIVTHRGPLGLTELTEIEGLNPTMLSRVVGKLDSFGLIRRLRDPEDFRAARVEVTPEGKQANQRIAAQRAAILSERVSGLPPEQEAALVEALPALENLAEDLRAVVRRGRSERALSGVSSAGTPARSGRPRRSGFRARPG
jgi:DNA-binding MarR family transcriptional regulator